MTYKKNIYFAQTLIHSSLILANCSTGERPSWLQIIGRFRLQWMYISGVKKWSGWRVYSQEIPVLLTGRVWDQAFLFIYYLEHFHCCSASVVSDSLWAPHRLQHADACQHPLSCTNSQSLLKLMFIEWVILSNHLILCGSSVGPYRQRIFLISWIDCWRRILLKIRGGNGNYLSRTFYSWWSLKAWVTMSLSASPKSKIFLFVCFFSPRWL